MNCLSMLHCQNIGVVSKNIFSQNILMAMVSRLISNIATPNFIPAWAKIQQIFLRQVEIELPENELNKVLSEISETTSIHHTRLTLFDDYVPHRKNIEKLMKTNL